jgi:hypothetical protein
MSCTAGYRLRISPRTIVNASLVFLGTCRCRQTKRRRAEKQGDTDCSKAQNSQSSPSHFPESSKRIVSAGDASVARCRGHCQYSPNRWRRGLGREVKLGHRSRHRAASALERMEHRRELGDRLFGGFGVHYGDISPGADARAIMLQIEESFRRGRRHTLACSIFAAETISEVTSAAN